MADRNILANLKKMTKNKNTNAQHAVKKTQKDINQMND